MLELLEVIQQEVEAREINEGVKTSEEGQSQAAMDIHLECSPLPKLHTNISVKRNSSEMCVL